VDPTTRVAQQDDDEGEIWVGGTTVAAGYWNNPDATEATFHAHTSSGDGPFLRTGDLGFVRDGHVYVTGRCKDLIILRGENHHPQDIEWAVHGAHPSLRENCAVAFSVDRDDSEALVVVVEIRPDRMNDADEVFAALRHKLAAHGVVPRVMILSPARAVPKTTSGKLKRQHARRLFLDHALPELHRWEPASSVEERPLDLLLHGVPARALRRRAIHHVQTRVAELLAVDAEDIDADVPLRDLGLDSIRAVELIEQVGRDAGHDIPTSAAFDHPTVEAIADYLLTLGQAVDTPSVGSDDASDALLEELSDLGFD
jgi:acyl carrier protein